MTRIGLPHTLQGGADLIGLGNHVALSGRRHTIRVGPGATPVADAIEPVVVLAIAWISREHGTNGRFGDDPMTIGAARGATTAAPVSRAMLVVAGAGV